jgi:Family of unknown function (DUF6152)
MKRFIAASVCVLAAAAGFSDTAAGGHHSFAATYRESESVTIEGELVQLDFRNPHSFVHVLVKEKDGTVRYAVEWGGVGQLGQQGVTRDTLRNGDHVIITGSPGRNPADRRVRLVTLRRPSDGFTWGQEPGQTVD